MELLPHVELATGADPTGTVIWMHGLGADGWDFVPIVREIPLPGDLALRFIFPHAPVRPVTINNGMEMRAWYDIALMNDLSRQTDERSIRESQAMVEELITRESQRGIDPDRIVLAGFSQGGVIALQTGLRYRAPLAGIIALSTYLALDESLDAEAQAANREVPILMAHGTQDPVIPMQLAERSRDSLTRRGYKVDWQAYPMPHSVCAEEVEEIGEFLMEHLGGEKPAGRSSILLAR
jgi:phospholipase/carboxylesterase